MIINGTCVIALQPKLRLIFGSLGFGLIVWLLNGEGEREKKRKNHVIDTLKVFIFKLYFMEFLNTVIRQI